MMDNVNLALRGSFADLVDKLEKRVTRLTIRALNDMLDEVLAHAREKNQTLRQALVLMYARQREDS